MYGSILSAVLLLALGTQPAALLRSRCSHHAATIQSVHMQRVAPLPSSPPSGCFALRGGSQNEEDTMDEKDEEDLRTDGPSKQALKRIRKQEQYAEKKLARKQVRHANTHIPTLK